jgi:uridine kinase
VCGTSARITEHPERSRPEARATVLSRLAELIEGVQRPHPTRVAVDGPDAAGKTTLADELASLLSSGGRAVVRASIDGFHRPRAERYRRGADSPEGYVQDSFDLDALRAVLLDPLGPGGSRRYRTAVFDHQADAPSPETTAVAADDAVLLVDGVFLLRRELVASWDLRILVSISPEETLRRAMARDVPLLGSRAEVERRYRARYLPGQRLYAAAALPARAADAIVWNEDPARPWLSVPAAEPSGRR